MTNPVDLCSNRLRRDVCTKHGEKFIKPDAWGDHFLYIPRHLRKATGSSRDRQKTIINDS
jgi:hypothetical protein